MPDGRTITVSISREQDNFNISFKAQPDAGILKWGLSIDSTEREYYTGLMERVLMVHKRNPGRPASLKQWICVGRKWR